MSISEKLAQVITRALVQKPERRVCNAVAAHIQESLKTTANSFEGTIPTNILKIARDFAKRDSKSH